MSRIDVQKFLVFNPRSAAFKDMADGADRIAALLETAKVKCDLEMQACLDDLLGAIYSLAFAKEEFEDRLAKPADPDPTLTRAKQVSEGKVRTDGKWIAGYHFNGALFRLAAVYHRALKIVTGKTSTGKMKELLRCIPFNWSGPELGKIQDEVNHLKHTRDGIAQRRSVTFDGALAATKELLSLMEEWERV